MWWGFGCPVGSWPPFGFVCGDGEKGVREHRQGDVSVPGVVFADLVLVESDLVLAGAEAFFDRPSSTGDIDEFTESGAPGVVAVVVGEFTGFHRLADHVLMVGVGGLYERPVVDPESLCSDATCSALPGRVV